MAPRLGSDGLTPKRARLVRGIAESIKKGQDKSVTQIALEAGFGNGTNAEAACASASRALSDVKVQAALDKALDDAGASLSKMARVVSEGMDATQSSMKIGGAEGLAAVQTPDHAIRLKAAELAGKWRGVGKSEEGQGGGTINLVAVIGIAKQAAQQRGLE